MRNPSSIRHITMKRALRPVVTPLEGRTVLSAGLNCTRPALGPAQLAVPGRVYTLDFFVHAGKLGKVKVARGRGFLFAGNPSSQHGYGYIELETGFRHNSSHVTLTAITAPVALASPSGPVALNMQVTQATGVFAHDLGATVSVNISVRNVLKRTMGLATLAVSFSAD